jgi:hypothetical protein
MQLKKDTKYDIHIEPMINGSYIVSIGCARLAFGDRTALTNAFLEYMADPLKVETRYNAAVGSPQPEQPRTAMIDTGAELKQPIDPEPQTDRSD